MISFEVHNIKAIKADAWNAEYGGYGALRIDLGEDRRVVLFMPYETAQEYASAINACNDREVVDKGLDMIKVKPINSSSMEPM